MFFENFQGFHGEGIGGNGFRIWCHKFSDRFVQELWVFEGGAAKIAVTEHAGEDPGFGVGEGDGAAARFGDCEQRCLHADILGGLSEALIGAHDFGNLEQKCLTETAGRVEFGKVVATKAAHFEEDHGQGIAEGEGGGGTGGRGEVERAGFFLVMVEEATVGKAHQGGIGERSHGDHTDAQALEVRDDANQVLSFAAIADENGEIPLAAKAEIAMQGLIGVEKGGWHAGAVEGAGKFLADGHIFTDAGENEFVAGGDALLKLVDHISEALVEFSGCALNRFALYLQAFAGLVDKLLRILVHYP